MKIDEILKHGILIGSRQMGVNKDESSDYDLVILEENVLKVLDGEELKSCDSLEEFSGGYEEQEVWGYELVDITKFINEDGILVNLFIYDCEVTYKKFIEFNKIIDMIDREKLKDRDYRIEKYIDVLELCKISAGAR